jgi:hypothetical protein
MNPGPGGSARVRRMLSQPAFLECGWRDITQGSMQPLRVASTNCLHSHQQAASLPAHRRTTVGRGPVRERGSRMIRSSHFCPCSVPWSLDRSYQLRPQRERRQSHETDGETLPLKHEVVQMLVDHQSLQPERHPYVFILPVRYAHIRNQLRAKGKWRYSDSRQKVIPKFNEAFGKILTRVESKWRQNVTSSNKCLSPCPRAC